MSEKENGQFLDEELKEKLEDVPTEDPFLTEYGTEGGGDENENIGFAEKWFPKEDNWQGKTNITPNQARHLAAARNLCEIYDEEIGDLEPFLIGMIEDYEQYLTSIDGMSREQQKKILVSLFGGSSQTQEETQSKMMQLMAARGNGDEE